MKEKNILIILKLLLKHRKERKTYMEDNNEGRNIELSNEKFKIFYNIIDTLSGHCNDLYIQNGIISQSNSKRSFVFYIDLSNILQDISFNINNLSVKKNLLNPFIKSKSDIILKCNENNIIFSDKMSEIFFNTPAIQFMEDVLIDNEKVKDMFGLIPENLILTETIPTEVLKRIRTYSKTLGSISISMLSENKKLNFFIYGLDKKSSNKVNIFKLDNIDIADFECSFPVGMFDCIYSLSTNDDNIWFNLYSFTNVKSNRKYLSFTICSSVKYSENLTTKFEIMSSVMI